MTPVATIQGNRTKEIWPGNVVTFELFCCGTAVKLVAAREYSSLVIEHQRLNEVDWKYSKREMLVWSKASKRFWEKVFEIKIRENKRARWRWERRRRLRRGALRFQPKNYLSRSSSTVSRSMIIPIFFSFSFFSFSAPSFSYFFLKRWSDDEKENLSFLRRLYQSLGDKQQHGPIRKSRFLVTLQDSMDHGEQLH